MLVVAVAVRVVREVAQVRAVLEVVGRASTVSIMETPALQTLAAVAVAVALMPGETMAGQVAQAALVL